MRRVLAELGDLIMLILLAVLVGAAWRVIFPAGSSRSVSLTATKAPACRCPCGRPTAR